jgi:hypothetical protein
LAEEGKKKKTTTTTTKKKKAHDQRRLLGTRKANPIQFQSTLGIETRRAFTASVACLALAHSQKLQEFVMS